MKKFLILLAIAAAVLPANAQNSQMHRLEEYLKGESFNVRHSKSAAYGLLGEGWYWSYSTKRKNLAAVDSIRKAFSKAATMAEESHLYECHKNGTDTLKYSIEFYHHDNDYEIASFFYGRRFDCSVNDSVSEFFYDHSYHWDSHIPYEEFKSFGTEEFIAKIEPVLKAASKQKGAKTYPLRLRHEENKWLEVSKKLTDRQLRDSIPKGYTCGVCYFLPAKYEKEAQDILNQLDSIALHYVDNHPEQMYEYCYEPRFRNKRTTDILDGKYRNQRNTYKLAAYMDEEGFYFLNFNACNLFWLARDMQKLKDWLLDKRDTFPRP